MEKIPTAILLGALTILTASCENVSVFLEQPVSVVAPVGTQVVLTCTVATEYRVVWSIGSSSGVLVAADSPDLITAFIDKGKTTALSTGVDRNPSLTINGTYDQNNGTTVQCLAVRLTRILERCGSDVITVTFYSPPSAPANLAATENGLGSLNISWSLVSIEGVAVNFTVTVTNLNDSSTGPMEVSGIQDQHYIFTLEDSTSCDVYSFQVTAMNGAGTGNTSDPISTSISSLPVPIPQQLSLTKIDADIFLYLILNATSVCPDNPYNYTLVLEDSTGMRTTVAYPATGNTTHLVVEDLMENTFYSLYVVASNQFGEGNKSATLEIATTDVQDVTICWINNTHFLIQCIYLSGSDASGCVYILVSMEEGVENVTGYVEREGNGMTVEVADVDSYSEVLAYDNTSGIHPIRVQIKDELCPTITTAIEGDLSPAPTVDYLTSVIIAGAVMVVGLMTLILVVLLFMCSRKKDNCCCYRSDGTSKKVDDNIIVTDDHQLYSTLNGTHRHNSTLEGAPSEMEAEDGYAKINHDPIYQVLENTNKSPILTYPSASTFCPVPAMDGSISELIPPLSQSDYAEIT